MYNKNNNRRLKGYYGFSKKYPSQHGTLYAIGESKRTKKKELRNKIILSSILILLLVAFLILFFFCRNLSRKPIPEAPSAEIKSTVSAENIGQIKAIFIENSLLEDENELDSTLKKAKANGINAVMLDFKDEDGSVLFPASLSIGVSLDGKNQISKALLDKLKDDGFTVIARIYCFCDSYAPQRLGSYVYEDGTKTQPWFDKPSSVGGRIWLNPTDSRSVGYITSVINEACLFGADCIFLKSVEFPVSEENPPVFTDDDASLSRNFILLNFIDSVVKKAGGCPVIVGFSYDGIEGNDEKWGGTLFDSAAAGCSPEIPQTENYAKYVGDMWILLNERAKNNFTTLKCIPTVKNMPENERFYDELNENGAQSYIIIP